MADSIRLQILKAIQTVLQGMSDGYTYPVTNPASVTIDPTVNVLAATPTDLPLYVIEPTPDGSRAFWPGMQLQNMLRGTITGRVDVSDVTDPQGRAAAWEGMAADLEKALSVDVTLGGLVYDIRLFEPAPFIGVGSPVVAVVQPWEARVHRTYGAP